MADFGYKISLFLVPRVFVALASLWFRTCRVRVVGEEFFDDAVKQPAIAAFWHYSFVYLFYHFRKISAVIMVSASRDGEYVAEVARLMGHVPARGSSHRSGLRALRSVIRLMEQGHHAALVADGSQGPPRKAQSGTILAAGKTGGRIIPTVWAANRYFKFNSWDKTAIPLPFSSIVLLYGEPMEIPADLSRQEIEQYRRQLEEVLNGLYKKAWSMAGKPPHDAMVEDTE